MENNTSTQQSLAWLEKLSQTAEEFKAVSEACSKQIDVLCLSQKNLFTSLNALLENMNEADPLYAELASLRYHFFRRHSPNIFSEFEGTFGDMLRCRQFLQKGQKLLKKQMKKITASEENPSGLEAFEQAVQENSLQLKSFNLHMNSIFKFGSLFEEALTSPPKNYKEAMVKFKRTTRENLRKIRAGKFSLYFSTPQENPEKEELVRGIFPFCIKRLRFCCFNYANFCQTLQESIVYNTPAIVGRKKYAFKEKNSIADRVSAPVKALIS